jgi:hypothetical protein
MGLLAAEEHSYAGAWLGFSEGTAVFANLGDAVAAVRKAAGLES